MAKYTLVGQDGNAFALMGYTQRALKKEGLGHLVERMTQQATAGNYHNLIAICNQYIKMANEKAIENGYEDEEEE